MLEQAGGARALSARSRRGEILAMLSLLQEVRKAALRHSSHSGRSYLQLLIAGNLTVPNAPFLQILYLKTHPLSFFRDCQR